MVKKKDKRNQFFRHNSIPSSDENTMLGRVGDKKISIYAWYWGKHDFGTREYCVPGVCIRKKNMSVRHKWRNVGEVDCWGGPACGELEKRVVVVLAPSDTGT